MSLTPFCSCFKGAMGKRTKFQTEDKAQLVLKVTRPERNVNESNVSNDVVVVKPCELPKVYLDIC